MALAQCRRSARPVLGEGCTMRWGEGAARGRSGEGCPVEAREGREGGDCGRRAHASALRPRRWQRRRGAGGQVAPPSGAQPASADDRRPPARSVRQLRASWAVAQSRHSFALRRRAAVASTRRRSSSGQGQRPNTVGLESLRRGVHCADPTFLTGSDVGLTRPGTSCKTPFCS